MDTDYFRKVMTAMILIVLVVLSFFILKPILLSIVAGILLAFIFEPVYRGIYSLTKMENVSAFIVCFILLIVIVIPAWFLIPIIVDQLFEVYVAVQKINFVPILQSIFPEVFQSPEISQQISSAISSFVSKAINSVIGSFTDLILNLPVVLLHLLIISFTFFFFLRDKEGIIDYIKSLLPFSKDVETKLFKSSKEITNSVLYGQIIIGIVQGLTVGIGFFIFGVSNSLLLTILACFAAMIPVIGAPIIWIPTVIYLFIAGNTGAAWGVLVFGLLSGTIDNVIRPFIVSRKAKLHTLLITIGMVGGFFFFGILGFVLGPLILAYLAIILEIYRDKRASSAGGVLIQTPKQG